MAIINAKRFYLKLEELASQHISTQEYQRQANKIVAELFAD